MSQAESPTSHRREDLLRGSHLLTSAQHKALDLLDRHGPLQLSNRTDEASRLVHRATADALVRAGICSIIESPAYRTMGLSVLQRLPEFDAHSGDAHAVSYSGEFQSWDEGAARARDCRSGECQRCHVTWTEYRN